MPIYFSPLRFRIQRLFPAFLLFTFLLTAAGTGSAATLSVPTSTYPTIQSAIDTASDGDIVLLADGTYTGPGNVDVDFGGRNITVTSRHGASSTIIDCGGSSSVDHRAFIVQDNETNAVISGLTIKNGYESSDSGGGIAIFSAAVTVTGCIISANTASYLGGGIYSDGTAAITNCTFSGNTGTYGGGLFNNDMATVTNCIFSSNTASYLGGAVFDEFVATITNCSISGNMDSGYQSGVYDDNGSTTLVNDILWSDSDQETNATSVTFCDVQGGYSGTGNINVDPRFTGAADLHLQTGSPCLGAGTATGAPATDKDGNSRPTAPSIGAYEVLALSHILWNRSDGTASVWNYSTASGAFTQNAYGPYAGWTASAIADGGTDGRTRVLWTRSDGTASIWSLNNSTGAFTQSAFGPYTGWTAKTLSVSTGSTTHILWANTDGRAAIWNYSTSSGTFTQNTYGPYAGWTASAIADGGTDGRTRVLWTRSDGTASIWSLNNSTGAFTQSAFGPYTGWTAKTLSVSTGSTTHILWTNTNGQASLWNYSTASGAFTQNAYGPYTGWIAKAVADGSDGQTRVLWGNTNGTMSLWNLDNTSGSYSQFSFGPYSSWTASAVSAQ